MFQRVRNRITALAVGLLVVLYSISALAVFGIVRRTVIGGIDLSLRGQVERIQAMGPSPAPRGIYTVFQEGPIQFLQPSNATTLENSFIKAVKKRQHPHYVDTSIGSSVYRILYVPLSPPSNPPSFILVATDISIELGVLDRLKSVLWLVGLFGGAAALLAGFFLADRMLRPIRTAWARQLEFVGNASHELRTPLAVIQANLGIVMEHTDETVVDNLEWLNHAHSESRRLTKLVQDLLTLARSDSERAPLALAPVDLRALCLHVYELYEGVAAMRGLTLRVEADNVVPLLADKDRLHQLLVILLDNATKFTQDGGIVTLRAQVQHNQAILEVQDTGQGIASADLPRVFDRFFTGEASRSRAEHGGTGLGLAIAQWIVEAHGGKISLTSPGPGQGTTVRIELPADRHSRRALNERSEEEPTEGTQA